MSEKDKTGPVAGIEGYCLRASGKDGPQIVQCTSKSWNEEREQVFLDALGASCNVTLAAQACGLSKGALYWRRRVDPGFADRWQAALSQGYVRVEMLLLDLAENTLAGRAPDPDSPIPAMTVKEAMNLLQLHAATAHKTGNGRRHWRARPRELEEVRESILARFEAIANLPDEAAA